MGVIAWKLLALHGDVKGDVVGWKARWSAAARP